MALEGPGLAPARWIPQVRETRHPRYPPAAHGLRLTHLFSIIFPHYAYKHLLFHRHTGFVRCSSTAPLCFHRHSRVIRRILKIAFLHHPRMKDILSTSQPSPLPSFLPLYPSSQTAWGGGQRGRLVFPAECHLLPTFTAPYQPTLPGPSRRKAGCGLNDPPRPSWARPPGSAAAPLRRGTSISGQTQPPWAAGELSHTAPQSSAPRPEGLVRRPTR